MNAILNKTNQNQCHLQVGDVITISCFTNITAYITLIDPYLQCCNIAWAINKTASVDPLHGMQMKAIRLVIVNKLIYLTGTLFTYTR